MRAKERSGAVIKKCVSGGKSEVHQPLSFLVERYTSDWVYGNNFVKVTVSYPRVVLKLGVKNKGHKEIDISREGAVRMAKLILSEYEAQKERFNCK